MSQQSSKNVSTFCEEAGALVASRVFRTICLTFIYYAIGIAVYSTQEEIQCNQVTDVTLPGNCKWSILDSIYFCTVTMSTVGYGDLYPTRRGTRVFIIVWIVVGIVFVFYLISSTFSRLYAHTSQDPVWVRIHVCTTSASNLTNVSKMA